MSALKTTVVTVGLIAGLCTVAQPLARAHAESAQRAVCEQWLSVVNNERYDAAMRQYAAQVIRDCGFSVSYGGPVYAATTPLVPVIGAPAAQGRGIEVALTNTHSRHSVVAAINGANVRFVLDTGASISSITMDVALALTREGRLSNDDLRRPVSAGLADGTVVNYPTVAVNVSFGGRATAVRIAVGGSNLLGTDVLNQFGSYIIDNRRGVLVLN